MAIGDRLAINGRSPASRRGWQRVMKASRAASASSIVKARSSTLMFCRLAISITVARVTPFEDSELCRSGDVEPPRP